METRDTPQELANKDNLRNLLQKKDYKAIVELFKSHADKLFEYLIEESADKTVLKAFNTVLLGFVRAGNLDELIQFCSRLSSPYLEQVINYQDETNKNTALIWAAYLGRLPILRQLRDKYHADIELRSEIDGVQFNYLDNLSLNMRNRIKNQKANEIDFKELGGILNEFKDINLDVVNSKDPSLAYVLFDLMRDALYDTSETDIFQTIQTHFPRAYFLELINKVDNRPEQFKQGSGRTLLLWAAFCGRLAILKNLLSIEGVNQQLRCKKYNFSYVEHLIRHLLDLTKEVNSYKTINYWHIGKALSEFKLPFSSSSALTSNLFAIILKCVKEGDLKTLEKIHDNLPGAYFVELINQQDNSDGGKKESPLHWAAYQGNPEMVKRLIGWGANKELRCQDHYTYLDELTVYLRDSLIFIATDRYSKLKQILEIDKNINLTAVHRKESPKTALEALNTVLVNFAKIGDLKNLTQFCDSLPSPYLEQVINYQDETNKNTALMWAAYMGHLPVLKKLRDDYHAKIELKSQFQFSYLDNVSLNVRDRIKNKKASEIKFEEIGEILNECKEINLDVVNSKEPSLAYVLFDLMRDALSTGQTDISQAIQTHLPQAYFLELINKVDDRPDNNQLKQGHDETLLHWAAFHGDHSIVDFLIDQGVQETLSHHEIEGLKKALLKKNSRNCTPFHYAIYRGSSKLIEKCLSILQAPSQSADAKPANIRSLFDETLDQNTILHMLLAGETELKAFNLLSNFFEKNNQNENMLTGMSLLDKQDMTPFMYASRKKDSHYYQTILNKCDNDLVKKQMLLTKSNKQGYTALHFILQNGSPAAIAPLFDIVDPAELFNLVNKKPTLQSAFAKNPNSQSIQALLTSHIGLFQLYAYLEKRSHEKIGSEKDYHNRLEDFQSILNELKMNYQSSDTLIEFKHSSRAFLKTSFMSTSRYANSVNDLQGRVTKRQFDAFRQFIKESPMVSETQLAIASELSDRGSHLTLIYDYLKNGYQKNSHGFFAARHRLAIDKLADHFRQLLTAGLKGAILPTTPADLHDRNYIGLVRQLKTVPRELYQDFISRLSERDSFDHSLKSLLTSSELAAPPQPVAAPVGYDYHMTEKEKRDNETFAAVVFENSQPQLQYERFYPGGSR